MFNALNTKWDRRTFRRMTNIMDEMDKEFPWYNGLPESEQFKLAVQFASARKTGLQSYKLLLTDNLVPIMISLVALLAALLK